MPRRVCGCLLLVGQEVVLEEVQLSQFLGLQKVRVAALVAMMKTKKPNNNLFSCFFRFRSLTFDSTSFRSVRTEGNFL